jgi:hypothetical protein
MERPNTVQNQSTNILGLTTKKYRLDERILNKFRDGKFHNTRPAGKPRRRWEDVVRKDTSQIVGIQGWRRRAEDREKWRGLLRGARAQKGL